MSVFAVAVVVAGHGDVVREAPQLPLRLALDAPLSVGRTPVEDRDVGDAVAVVVAGHGDVVRQAPQLQGLALDAPLARRSPRWKTARSVAGSLS